MQLAVMALGVYKVWIMGLLPTSGSDFLAWKGERPVYPPQHCVNTGYGMECSVINNQSKSMLCRLLSPRPIPTSLASKHLRHTFLVTFPKHSTSPFAVSHHSHHISILKISPPAMKSNSAMTTTITSDYKPASYISHIPNRDTCPPISTMSPFPPHTALSYDPNSSSASPSVHSVNPPL